MVLYAVVLNRLLDRYLYLINETYRAAVINTCRGWLRNLSGLESDTKNSVLTKLAICSLSILEQRKWGHMLFPIIILKHEQGWRYYTHNTITHFYKYTHKVDIWSLSTSQHLPSSYLCYNTTCTFISLYKWFLPTVLWILRIWTSY